MNEPKETETKPTTDEIVSEYVHMERQTRTVNIKEGSENEKMW